MTTRKTKAAGRLAALLMALLAVQAGAGEAKLPVSAGTGPNPTLPPSVQEKIPTVNVADAHGWNKGQKPAAAAGMKVGAFADGLQHPRWLLVLPNGDVLVAETDAPPKPAEKGIKNWFMKLFMKDAGSGSPSANRITLLRDANGDGIADLKTTFIENLNSPFGMVLVDGSLYVADTDAVLRFPYSTGQERITAQPVKLLDLPAGPRNHHWTKNLIATPDGKTLYVTVGSNSNAGENGMDEEQDRAAIWEVDRLTGQHRIYAGGLRNPNGMAWEPSTGALWVAVNERDELGGDLVPDYMTAVKDGGFYGWPWSYYGDNVDERVMPQHPEWTGKAIKPDYALGPHTASLGLCWSDGALLRALGPGMFVGQHGSWNRKPRSGYKVIFVPFEQGKPVGQPVDVLTGFHDEDRGIAYGRPVGVAMAQDGALLVADDVGNMIWRVAPAK